MPRMKLRDGVLIRDTWHEAGEIVDIHPKLADRFLAAGAIPVGPPVERAIDEPKAPERATARPQR